MFEVEFEKLQLNKVLVVLRSCGSQWQKSFIKSLEHGRAVVDLADPIVREQALSYPEEFIRNPAKPTLLYHLQKAPELLPLLAQAKVPAGSFVAVSEQSYSLLERLGEQGSEGTKAQGAEETVVETTAFWKNLALVELPLEEQLRLPFVPDRANVLNGVQEDGTGIAKDAKQGKNVLESIVVGSLPRQEGLPA